MQNDNTRRVLRSIYFFGSIQVFQVFFSILKIKFVSIFVGPAGLGDFTLFNNLLTTIVFVLGLGLYNGAVRYIAIENQSSNISNLQKIISVVNIITFITSLFAGLLIFFLAEDFSYFLFKSENRIFEIRVLALILFIAALCNRNTMIFQGLGMYKQLGYTTLISSILASIVVFFIYYFLRNDGLALAIVSTSVITYVVGFFYIKRIHFKVNNFVLSKNLFVKGKELIGLSLTILLGSLFGNIIVNIINIYILKQGSSDQLGFYNAGLTISVQYVGLVFYSISMEFYPRLAAINDNNIKMHILINEQARVVLIILFPILFLMQVLAPLLVSILFTTEFIVIAPFIQITTIAVVFQALAYIISNVALAKADKSVSLIYNSLIPGVVSLVSSIIGYHLIGLNGVAFGIIAVNISHFGFMYLICKKKYGITYDKSIFKLSIKMIIVLLFALLIQHYFKSLLAYCLLTFLLCYVLFFTFKNVKTMLPSNVKLSQFFQLFRKM